MKIQEVIVVEGKKDTMKIKLALDADTIETNGSAVDKQVLELIAHAQEKRGVIIFTDPDYPGQRIRQMINEHVPGCKHAFLPKRKALPNLKGRSVGIEHATIEDIHEALMHVYEVNEAKQDNEIQRNDLVSYGLIGGSRAKDRRIALGEYLHIGYTNGKQLKKRLEMFQITKKELNVAMLHILERENSDG